MPFAKLGVQECVYNRVYSEYSEYSEYSRYSSDATEVRCVRKHERPKEMEPTRVARVADWLVRMLLGGPPTVPLLLVAGSSLRLGSLLSINQSVMSNPDGIDQTITEG